MKRFEMTIREDGITIRREAEERLTGTQKFQLLAGLIGTAAILGFFWILTSI
ncbi:hypothetical protein [Pseudoflavonifractor sp. 524-17]|uniref:hypothetical protein n=1 Tax=Pseudoflavonifractor sp. 524-17 TaxID=2304577 RepID=UPI00137B4F25|nr:hypothetical protein [Pseudoflavonifractor sp. 524-17]